MLDVAAGPGTLTLLVAGLGTKVVATDFSPVIARRVTPPATARKRQVTELDKARTELENITNAIRQGVLTPTTKQMLEEAERRGAYLEAALKTPTVKHNALAILPSVVEGYLKDLRGSLGRNPERARELLVKLLGPITLRRDGDKLVAK